MGFFQLGSNPPKAKQPQKGLAFHEKEEKDEKYIGKLIRKNTKITGAY